MGDVIEKLTGGASITPDDYVDVGYRTIPNESAIKVSINYPEYKNTVEHALPKFKYYAKFFAELRSTLDDEIKPLV